MSLLLFWITETEGEDKMEVDGVLHGEVLGSRGVYG